eukprot:1282633-Rhodomonas_salina.1
MKLQHDEMHVPFGWRVNFVCICFVSGQPVAEELLFPVIQHLLQFQNSWPNFKQGFKMVLDTFVHNTQSTHHSDTLLSTENTESTQQ